MKIFLAVFFVFSLANGSPACAQVFDGLRVSLKAGAAYSYITNLETTILSEPYFTDYTLAGRHLFGFFAGMGINSEIKNSIVSADFGVFYSQQGSGLDFDNTAKEFNYTVRFKYQFLDFPLVFKVYPFAKARLGLFGFNVGAGPEVAFNIAPEKIIYKSGGPGRLPAFGTDLEEQQQLRNVLKGKNDLGMIFHAGYDIPSVGLNIELRYHLGLSDVVETLPNSYNFIENKNTNNTIQLSVAWEFFSTYPKKRVLVIGNPGS